MTIRWLFNIRKLIPFQFLEQQKVINPYNLMLHLLTFLLTCIFNSSIICWNSMFWSSVAFKLVLYWLEGKSGNNFASHLKTTLDDPAVREFLSLVIGPWRVIFDDPNTYYHIHTLKKQHPAYSFQLLVCFLALLYHLARLNIGFLQRIKSSKSV